MKICFSCRTILDVEGKPGRRDTCHSCGSDLRVCLNCRFYDSGAYNDCREPSAERVADKGRANFCDYFEFAEGTEVSATDGKAEAKKKLDDLFR